MARAPARRRRVGARHPDRVEQPVEDAEASGVGHPADHRRADLPARAQPEHRVEVLGRDDREHAFLALRGHHLDAVHARLALGDAGEVDVHPGAGLGRPVSDAAHEMPAAPRSCTPMARPSSSSSMHASMRRFSSNGSPTCTDGRLASEPFLEPGRRQHARAADAVAAGGRTEQHREVALALGLGQHEALDRQHAEAQHVDERVLAVAVVEDHLAADRGHTDRVAVPADAGDHAFEQVAGAGVVEGAEAQRVHQGDGAGAHGEDVADDAADAGGRALVGLHRGRVVVALDADRHRDAVADVDDAGALAGADEHPGRLGREAAEVALGRLVGAVLRPHDGVHRQLDLGGRSTQEIDHRGQLVVGHSELPVQTGAQRRGSRRRSRGAGTGVIVVLVGGRVLVAHEGPSSSPALHLDILSRTALLRPNAAVTGALLQRQRGTFIQCNLVEDHNGQISHPDHVGSAQSGPRRRALRRARGQGLSRGPRAEPAAARSQAHPRLGDEASRRDRRPAPRGQRAGAAPARAGAHGPREGTGVDGPEGRHHRAGIRVREDREELLAAQGHLLRRLARAGRVGRRPQEGRRLPGILTAGSARRRRSQRAFPAANNAIALSIRRCRVSSLLAR